MLEDLSKQALIGTSRAGDAKLSLPPQLETAIEVLPQVSPEAALLRAALMCGNYERCGRKPEVVHTPNEPAGADQMSACTSRASQILDLLLSSPDNRSNQQLILEWLDSAATAGRRAPHRLLPALLDYAASHRSSRDTIAKIIDSRGAWLMKQNPRWRFAAAADEDPALVWETGNAQQRFSVLQQLRRVDPARARSLIESTWKEDQAEERASFIETMAVGLDASDEPLLEQALDDKSKRVRAAAAELLTALTESAFVQRMIDRAVPLLDYVPAEGARILKLKKARPATIEVTLPPEPLDKAWQRDGIAEKPAEKMGVRQWWLLQLVSYVPPHIWTDRWKVTAQDCIAAAGDHSAILLQGWQLAAKRCVDQAWLRAILLSISAQEMGKADVELISLLEPAAQREAVISILDRAQLDLEKVGLLLDASRCALDRDAALRAVEKIEFHLLAANGTYQYYLPQIMQNLALRVPPEMHDALSARWSGEKWEANRRALDEFFSVLVLRRDIKREFGS